MLTAILRTARRVSLTLASATLLITPAFAEELLDDADSMQRANQNSKEAEANLGALADVSANYKGLVIRTRDDEFTFAFGGRLQFDAAVFIQDETKLGNGSEVRRGRIKSYGTVWTNWDYKLEVNFDPDLDVPITDGWFRYSGYKTFTVTLGHQKVPFGQSSMSSSNWQVFQERALPDAFSNNEEQGRRRLGLVLASHGDVWSYAGGVFSGGLGDSGAEDEDFGVAHRIVLAPIAEKTKVVAVGGSAAYRYFDAPSVLRFSAQPEAHLAGAKLVDTGKLRASRSVFMYNFEATVVAGRFHGQAEYTATHIRGRMGQRNFTLSGFYVQAGVFLTGESRNYDQKSGKYKRVMPKREALGAWELAARFSQIDLTDRTLLGGVQRDLTVGLNWWVNPNVMFRFNYVYGNTAPNSNIPDSALKQTAGQDEHIHAFTGRAQVVF